MLVLHSIWDRERLCFWAESSTLPLVVSKDVGRRKNGLCERHPFALRGSELKDQLPEIFRQSKRSIMSITLRLPSAKKGPMSSPWLLLEDHVSEKAACLENWAVDTLAFDISSAFDLLTDLPAHPPQGIAFADSIRFWSDLAMFSLELIAREQFVPAIKAEKASWVSVIDEGNSERLKVFSESMPPSCRGYLPHDGLALSPHDLILTFINGAVDSFIFN